MQSVRFPLYLYTLGWQPSFLTKGRVNKLCYFEIRCRRASGVRKSPQKSFRKVFSCQWMQLSLGRQLPKSREEKVLCPPLLSEGHSSIHQSCPLQSLWASATPRPEAVFTTGIGLSLRCFRGAQWPSGVACLNMGATWKSLPHCLKNPRPVPHGLRVLETGIRICPDPESLHIYLFG